MNRTAALATSLLAVAICWVPCVAQSPRTSAVHVGWAVDVSEPGVAEIVEIVTKYLSDVAAQDTNPRWSTADRERHDYDLTAPWLYRGYSAVVAEVSPAVEDSSAFVIKTFFGVVSGENEFQPIGLQRLFAVREDAQWVLEGTLSHYTRDWKNHVQGSITYHYAPDQVLDMSRAQLAQQFVDSLAKVLDLNDSPPIAYYITDSPEEMYRTIGLDWAFPPGITGRAYVADRIVLTGDPTQAEAHFHELTHAVVGASNHPGGRHPMLEEGMAVWLGGLQGDSYHDVLRQLIEYQSANKDLQFSEVLEGGRYTGPITLYATGALYLERLHAAGGREALKSALALGSDDKTILELGEQYLGPQDWELWWRRAPRDALNGLGGDAP